WFVLLGVHAAAPLPELRARPVSERRGGLSALRRLAAPRAIVLVLVGQQLVRGMLPVLLVSLAAGPLGAGDQGIGLLNAAAGAGGLIGGVVALGIANRFRLGTAFAVGVGAWGVGLVIPGLAPVLIVAVLSLAAGGVGRSILEVTGITLLQRTVPVRDRPDVFGLLEALATLSLAVGAVAAAVLVQDA